MKTTYKLGIGIILILYTFCISCEDFVDVGPPTSRVVSDVVFQKDGTAISAVVGIYHQLYRLTNFMSGSQYSIAATCGLAADELETHTITDIFDEFYRNEITIGNQTNYTIWSTSYNIIYMANKVLEGLTSSKGVSGDIKRQLEGEAKFIRAFTHFYLVNIYGEIPIVTVTDYNENSMVSRSPIEKVYTQIIKDLEDSRYLLDDDYVTVERTRPNKSAATTLLARVNLYLENWGIAESLAGEVILETGTYDLLNDLSSVFLANSREAIWQIAPVGVSHTWEGNIFILKAAPTLFSLSNNMVNAFESGDSRLENWVGVYNGEIETFYYPNKYKVKASTDEPTEYSTVLRYSELYLIRAEARAQQGKLSAAITDLDVVRDRAGLPLIKNTHPQITQNEILLRIAQERRVELFTECGHRWLDLKRTGKSNNVLSLEKPNWNSTDVLFPIPEIELNKNNNLTQNPGY